MGMKKNLGVRGSSTRGELDPFSEIGRRVIFSIKSKNNYIWGFPSVTTTWQFRDWSCPERLINLKEDGNQAAFAFVNGNQRGMLIEKIKLSQLDWLGRLHRLAV
ncbi:hypothetical protein DPMN_169505 [Dreissena polymorpha]|uniref:Uncharacterized protein n=1 Tax=Dreissena polymorpha TaxID=45954 RepID=A0A9D4DVN7_DREPO|nr:hypothetical protein DPMN_169505 [Dreissena polymorpha]